MSLNNLRKLATAGLDVADVSSRILVVEAMFAATQNQKEKVMPQVPTTSAAPASQAPTATATKTPKAKAKKAAAKKTPKTTAKKVTPRAKKDGLRKPQVRILKALSKANKAMTRADIAEKAPVDVATCVEYLGSDDPKVRAANDKKHFPSLVSLGFVKASEGSPRKLENGNFSEAAGPTEYAITASGRSALEKAIK